MEIISIILYSFEIIFKPGKLNGNADALSRVIMDNENQITKNNNKTLYLYDRTVNSLDLHINDLIFLKKHNVTNKLCVNWEDTFKIIQIHDKENITIMKSQREIKVHINNVKRYYTDETD